MWDGGSVVVGEVGVLEGGGVECEFVEFSIVRGLS